MSIYCNHKQAVRDCFKASFCLSIMCLILHSTLAEHASSIVLSKDIKLPNKLPASSKSPLLTAVLAGGSFVAPCVPSCGLSSASVPGSGESYVIAISMVFSAASTSLRPRTARDIGLPVSIVSTAWLA